MTRRTVSGLLLTSALPRLIAAKPADFNGRWNLTVAQEARRRAWWLEVRGAGTPTLSGRFVGAPGGQMDDIPEMRVEGDELVWTFPRRYRAPGQLLPASKGTYRARLTGGRLEGSFAIEGQPPATTFTGVRAPALPDRDDGTWREGKPVELFNGRDLSGWSAVGGGPLRGWVVKGGLMGNEGVAANLVSDAKFWNFRLLADYRVGPKSNSGVGLRARYEVQIYEDHGQPASLHGNGAIYSRIVPRVNASRPAGEWQTMDVRLVGREVTVALNGITVIQRQEIEGLTAVATDPHEAEPGPITLQGDHGMVEFRRLAVFPLTK